jgi:hypothetical protein
MGRIANGNNKTKRRLKVMTGKDVQDPAMLKQKNAGGK